VKLSPGRREGWGEGVFKILFCFSLSFSGFIGDKLNYFSQVEFVSPMMVINC